MRREAVNPDGLFNSVQFGFPHAIRHSGGEMVQLAGQVASNANGELVGPGDVQLQTRQALANLSKVLTAVGATPENIVRLRTYVVNHSPDKLAPVIGEIKQFYGAAMPAANTFLGVQALARPGFLVEIEATAVVPERP